MYVPSGLSRKIYAVAVIESGEVTYLGGSNYSAAEKLVPGTCFAIATTYDAARRLVKSEARRFRKKD